jgi:hypothetical protein
MAQHMNPVGVVFPRCFIQQCAAIAWPPSSPDLSAWYLFLWGGLKSNILYMCIITDENTGVPPDLLHHVMDV